MSFSVLRGAPYASQYYLDGILDEVLQSGLTGVAERERVSLPQILFYCLRKNPNDIFMTNGATGEKISNAEILKHAVSVARALLSKGVRGKNVMIIMRNHQAMVSVYFAVIFSGTVPFIIDPNSTVFEIIQFLKTIVPCMVFCDEERYNDVDKALKDIPDAKTEVKISDKEELLEDLASGFSDEADGFQIPDIDVDATVMMLPTSGSTGLPKATLISHRGLITQLPISWCFHTKFPTPVDCYMLLTTPQWITFTLTVTSCVVYRVPLLMSRKKPTVEWVKEMLVTYRPTLTFFGPAFVKSLLPAITEDHLSSLKHCLVLGAPSSIEMMAELRDKLSPSAKLSDVYGCTESQGYITIPGSVTPLKSAGLIVNIFDYKLLDDNGKEVGLNCNGELYLKGPSIFKGYYKNPDLFEECFVDGWFRTGDLFQIDEMERMFYIERKKFCFKFMGCHVSPEEVEQIIGSVAGVEECVVCATESGPAALIIQHKNCRVTREQIHKAVNDKLSEHKQLHGGIAFVESLPHTHSGKIKREDCKILLSELITTGQLY